MTWVLLQASAPTAPDLSVYGPYGLLVGALIAVGVLWREDRRVYRERIADLRTQRDAATEGWKEQTEANKALVAADIAHDAKHAKALEDLAKAWRDKTRTDAARRRLGDRERALDESSRDSDT